MSVRMSGHERTPSTWISPWRDMSYIPPGADTLSRGRLPALRSRPAEGRPARGCLEGSDRPSAMIGVAVGVRWWGSERTMLVMSATP